jgi:hypothetical protein
MDPSWEKPTGSPARETGPPAPEVPAPEILPPPTGDSLLYAYLESTTPERSRKLWLRGPLTARLERILLGGICAGTVTGTLYGAGAAHLSSQETLIAIALEIVVPPVVFLSSRWRNKGNKLTSGKH